MSIVSRISLARRFVPYCVSSTKPCTVHPGVIPGSVNALTVIWLRPKSRALGDFFEVGTRPQNKQRETRPLFKKPHHRTGLRRERSLEALIPGRQSTAADGGNQQWSVSGRGSASLSLEVLPGRWRRPPAHFRRTPAASIPIRSTDKQSIHRQTIEPSRRHADIP